MPDTKLVDDVAKATADAAQSGKFAALDAIVAEFGVPEMDGGALFLLAARDPRTKGKTPEDIAGMIKADDSVLDDLLAYRPGGTLEHSGKGSSAGSSTEGVEDDMGAEESVEPPEEIGKMKEYLDKSSSMKGRDPKKAMGNLKKMGKSMKDLETDPSAKMDFMGME